MRPFTISGVVLAFAVASVASGAFGCASPEDDGSGPAREWDLQGESTANPDGPASATSSEGGAPAASGTPASACTPMTCQDLGKTTGTTDNGCGTEIDCGAAATCTDAKAGNGTKDLAADLGAMTDYPTTSRVVADLTLADGAEDWFTFKVSDKGFGGNPRVDATVTSPTAQVSVFYVCDSQPDYSKCTSTTGTAATDIGKGCLAQGTVSLSTECSGLNENGTGYIRVRKSAADAQCTTYALTVKID